jgi:murein DD-endopeptidase MepM/ murein hydrolase activator NlpD
MRASTLHLVLRLIVLLAPPLLLAGCSPSFHGGAPVSRGAPSSQGCSGAVTVYAGDTLYSIARRCNVSVRDLIEINNLAAPYVISPGMQLRMPGGGEYVVQRGDALSLIARRLGIEFQTLARLNGKAAPYTIFVGEKLRLPGGRGGATTATTGTGGALVIASPNSTRKGAEPSTASTRVQSQAAAPVGTAEGSAAPEARHPAFEPRQTLPPPPPPMGGKGFIWPVKGDLVAEFGPMAGSKGQHNDGINIAAARGTPVWAVENGVVAYVGNELKGFGNLLLVKHADGWVSAYAHNDQLMVRKGDAVKRGQQIATVGTSGGVDAPQLHFELRRGTEAVNPVAHLNGA